MIESYGMIWAIVCPLVFLAGFVDAVAGGGGLISLPAYLFAGLPTHVAAGTNKFAMSFGTVSSLISYAKSGNFRVRAAVCAAAGALFGSAGGTMLALYISDQALRLLMMLALPLVAVFLAVQKGFGTQSEEKEYSDKKTMLLSGIIGIAIGCYDGLIGPGTGTFLILAFTGVLGYNLLTSSGCAKAANSASNIASVVLFLINGKVLFPVAIPAALCAIAGNQIGSKMAIRGGAKFVRILIFVVLGMLFVKTIWDFVG